MHVYRLSISPRFQLPIRNALPKAEDQRHEQKRSANYTANQLIMEF
jgi:hypothetical protein